MMRSDRKRRTGIPLFTLLLLTVGLTWPVARYLTTHVVDRQDPLLNAWIMAWEAHQLLHDPLAIFDANIFLPYRNTLAFSEILLSTSLLVTPFQWAGATALTSYNLAFLLSFFTTALGAYLFTLHLTHSRPAGLLAGVAFAFSPYRMGHLSQVQLLATGWLPLALLYLDRTLQNRSSYRRDAFLFGFFFLVQALASFYSAFFTAGACLLYTLLWWILVAHEEVPWRALRALTVVTVVAGLLLVPIVVPYLQVQQQFDAGWSLADNETFSASLQAYFYAPASTPIWGELTSRFRYIYGPCCPPDTLFPGLTLLVLAAVALFRGADARRWAVAGLLVLGFLLSLGPTLKIEAGVPTDLRLPYYWLFTYLPGFDAMRAPVRWALLVTLALSLLAAWAVASRPWLALLALALVVLEFTVVPVRLVAAPEPPPVVDWLDAQPPTRILELPLAAELPRETVPDDRPRRSWEVSRLLEYQYFSTWHWHATPDGYSGYVPPRHGEFAREMQGFPSERSLALLQDLGIEYVVLHEDELPPARAVHIRRGLDESDTLEMVACFTEQTQIDTCDGATDRVLRVAPGDTTTITPNWNLQVTAVAAPEEPAPLWLTATVPGTVPVRADRQFPLEVNWEGPSSYSEQHHVTLPLVLEEVVAVRLPLDTPEQAGTYTVTVDASALPGAPPPMNTQVTVGDSMGGTVTAPRAVVLHSSDVPALEPGVENSIVLGWRTYELLDAYYSISVRVVTEDGTVVAQQDGPPGGETPTVAWLPGQTYGAVWALDVPADAPASLHVEVLWYEPATAREILVWYDGAWQPVVSIAAP